MVVAMMDMIVTTAVWDRIIDINRQRVWNCGCNIPYSVCYVLAEMPPVYIKL